MPLKKYFVHLDWKTGKNKGTIISQIDEFCQPIINLVYYVI